MQETKAQIGIFSRFTSFVRKNDIFGHPITLKYKGDSSYQTFLGGFFTLVSAAVLAYFMYT